MPPLAIPTAPIPLLPSLRHPAASPRELPPECHSSTHYTNTHPLPPRKDQSDGIRHTPFCEARGAVRQKALLQLSVIMSIAVLWQVHSVVIMGAASWLLYPVSLTEL